MARQAEGNVLRDYGGTILVAVVIAFLVRFFAIEAFRIPASTMRPTLEPGETVFVSKSTFGLRLPFFKNALSSGRAPFRGEVVLFSPPDEPQIDVIKRVIGVEGDVIQIKGGKLLVNGKPLSVKMTDSSCGMEALTAQKNYRVCWEPPRVEDFGPQKISQGTVFLMSDLRTGSAPEVNKLPTWGIFPVSSLKGKVLWIWLSLQPHVFGEANGWFPRFRFERMFRRVE